jgi:hypothetical protein
MADKLNINALGQVLDTTWGRTSTPKTASYSVKFSLQGNILVVSYAAIVNFGTEKEMALMKQRYDEESREIISAALKNAKASYKKLTGKNFSSKEHSTSDHLEIINFNIHNPKRTAYYRRKTAFEIA